MTTRNLLLAATLGASSLFAIALPNVAHAQTSTTGAVQGVVTDSKTNEPLPGVTVIITSPGLSQTQTAITDERGFYRIGDLPPGDYLVTFYFADITVEQSGVHVGLDKTSSVMQKINQQQAGGETIHVQAKAPLIDPTSTSQGITLDKNYLTNVPVPGRTFDQALGAAAGSSSDALGVSFSGSTSLENQYYVDGVSTTGLTFGTVGTPVVNDFIEEIEVLTGGYNAEYGRSTGGIVNVVTKTGSNEFKGSVFGTYQPGFLTAAAKVAPRNAASIDLTGNVNYNADFGFELGGPIIKDKLWFFVGLDPTFYQLDITRTTKSETDCRILMANGQLSQCQKMYADSQADIDPKTGFFITDNVDSTIRSLTTQTYNMIAKINYAATPEHQGQISFSGLPSHERAPIEAFGVPGPANEGDVIDSLTTDLGAKWTSKFNDNKTEVEAVLGWHHAAENSDAIDPTLENQPQQALYDGSLSTWGPGFKESQATIKGCTDDMNPNSTTDKYPQITNCPMKTESYLIGGPGFIDRNVEDRRSATLNITQRVKAAGTHEIKAGLDAEDNTSSKARLYSGNASTFGGVAIQNDVGGHVVYLNRWVQLGAQNTPGSVNPDSSYFAENCSTPNPNGATVGGSATENFYCAYTGGSPGSRGTVVLGNTLNWAAYVRDSWQIQPNLTLNAGVRYEEQRLRYAEFLQNTTDALTGEKLGTNALVLKGMIAPRVGLLYDWTKEGRSKVYANWGRFYESIPMDINERSFGGEVQYEQVFSANGANYGAGQQCGASTAGQAGQIGGPDGIGCAKNNMAVGDLRNQLIGAAGELIAPGTQAQYMDEFVAGFEYELIDDLKIGVSYQNRRLGRVIEDMSTDGANTYIIGNPGTWSSQDEKAFEDRIARTDDPTEKARLQHELTLFQGIRIFDPPRRDYNALQFTLTRRFSKRLYVQGSYTYSRTEGNYPGLYSPDNGQVDPNISSQYDLIELLANRIGPLPQDRPHYIKLDGYYTFDFKKQGALTVGARIRARSGIPENALAGHYLYGADESFLLPRGELGRTDFDHDVDLHVGYARHLSKNMNLEVYFDIFNVYDRQGTAEVDNTYAPYYRITGPAGGIGVQQNANPVSGGSYQDLIWVKTIDQNGNETPDPIGRNPNFHNTVVRYAPTMGRLGVRLTF